MQHSVSSSCEGGGDGGRGGDNEHETAEACHRMDYFMINGSIHCPPYYTCDFKADSCAISSGLQLDKSVCKILIYILIVNVFTLSTRPTSDSENHNAQCDIDLLDHCYGITLAHIYITIFERASFHSRSVSWSSP